MDDYVKIKKLQSGEGYALWKFQVKVILAASDLFGIVSGELACPVLAKRATETDAQAEERYRAELKVYNRADSQAQKVIVTSLDMQPMMHIINCTTSCEMWAKLQNIYEMKSVANVLILQQRYYNYTKDPSDSMAEHISKIQDIAYKLKECKEPLTDSMVMTKILVTLPPTYNHFYSAWESTSEDKRTLENLTTRLIMEESRLVMQDNNGDETVKAFSSKRLKPTNKIPNNRIITCYRCKKQGHIKRNCPEKNDVQKKNVKEAHTSEIIGKDAFISEVIAASSYSKSDTWYLDSGASDHMTSNKQWFSQYEQFDDPIPVKVGSGEIIFAYGKGRIDILSYAKGKWLNKYLENVLYVPKISLNLFSSGAAMDKGLKLTSDNKTCRLIKDEEIVAEGVRVNRLFEMKFKVVTKKVAEVHIANKKTAELKLWHERFAHQNITQVTNLMKEMGKDFEKCDKNWFCECCPLGKQQRYPFKTSLSISSKPGELIHSDLCGPMQVSSYGGSRYFVLFKDDYSHFKYVYFVKNKSEIKNKLEEFLKQIYIDNHHTVLTIRTDNGTEYINSNVKYMLDHEGIRHETTVPYSPQQNGAAEREMRTIVEAARTIIHARHMDLKFWAEAVNTAVYVINRTGKSTVDGKSPYELWYGRKPRIDHLRIFGSQVFVHIPKEKRKKFDPKSKEGIMVGYCTNKKAYRIWIHAEKKIEFSRDVLFNEDTKDNSNHVITNTDDLFVYIPTIPNPTSEDVTNVEVENANEVLVENQVSPHIAHVLEGTHNDDLEEDNNNDYHSFSEDEQPPEKEENTIRGTYFLRNRNQLKPSSHLGCVAEIIEPKTYKEAINCKDAHEWKKAMKEEYSALIKNDTWKLTELPPGRQYIDNRWIFKIKVGSNGEISRYKARLVVRGFSQKPGIDYEETFSPVVKFDSVRMILSITASENLVLGQFDVKTAFLNGDLKEDIYMCQPLGFTDGTNKVCKLQRSLYGLKQSARCWNQKFKDFLKRYDFVTSKADSCVFIKQTGTIKVILAIYVDDGLIAATNQDEVDKLLLQLENHFEITKCEIKLFLGLQVERSLSGSIFIHQRNYANQLLTKFKFEDCNPVSIPCDPNISLYVNDHLQKEETNKMINIPYREVVGSLIYLAVATRPDISFAVSKVSQYLDNYREIHWNAVKRIMKYIKGTLNYGLYFKSSCETTLNIYSDADFGNDIESRKSVSGFVFQMGESSITWKSQKQKLVALSTTESEFIAASEAVKEIIWIQRLSSELLSSHSQCPTSILHKFSKSLDILK